MDIKYYYKLQTLENDNAYIQLKDNKFIICTDTWLNKNATLQENLISEGIDDVFYQEVDINKIKEKTKYLIYFNLETKRFVTNYIEDNGYYIVETNPNYFQYKCNFLDKSQFMSIIFWKKDNDNLALISNITLLNIDGSEEEISFNRSSFYTTSELIKDLYGEDDCQEYIKQSKREEYRFILEENLNLRNSISYLDYEVDLLSSIIFDLLNNQTITSEIDSTKLKEYQNSLVKLNENNVLSIKNNIDKILEKKNLTRKNQEEYYNNILNLK